MATAAPCSQSTAADSDAAVECTEAACLESGVHAVPIEYASYVSVGPVRQTRVIKCCVVVRCSWHRARQWPDIYIYIYIHNACYILFLCLQGVDVMNMYEEHAMSAIYMDAEMSHHGDPGSGDNTESYHPGLVIEQLNKVLFLRQSYNPRVVGMQMSRCKYVKAVIASSALAPTPGKLLHLLLPFQQSQMLGTNIMQIVTCIGLNQCTTCPLYIQLERPDEIAFFVY